MVHGWLNLRCRTVDMGEPRLEGGPTINYMQIFKYLTPNLTLFKGKLYSFMKHIKKEKKGKNLISHPGLLALIFMKS